MADGEKVDIPDMIKQQTALALVLSPHSCFVCFDRNRKERPSSGVPAEQGARHSVLLNNPIL
jgi:hypothetical protein